MGLKSGEVMEPEAMVVDEFGHFRFGDDFFFPIEEPFVEEVKPFAGHIRPRDKDRSPLRLEIARLQHIELNVEIALRIELERVAAALFFRERWAKNVAALYSIGSGRSPLFLRGSYLP